MSTNRFFLSVLLALFAGVSLPAFASSGQRSFHPLDLSPSICELSPGDGIQSAIDDGCRVVRLHPGNYYENISVSSSDRVLKVKIMGLGETPSQVRLIHRGESVIKVYGNAGIFVENLTLTGLYSTNQDLPTDEDVDLLRPIEEWQSGSLPHGAGVDGTSILSEMHSYQNEVDEEHFASSGGCLYFNADKDLIVKNVLFAHCKAGTGSAIRVSRADFVSVTQSQFYKNISVESSNIYINANDTDKTALFSGLSFVSNVSETALIQILGLPAVEFSDAHFKFNYVGKDLITFDHDHRRSDLVELLFRDLFIESNVIGCSFIDVTEVELEPEDIHLLIENSRFVENILFIGSAGFDVEDIQTFSFFKNEVKGNVFLGDCIIDADELGEVFVQDSQFFGNFLSLRGSGKKSGVVVIDDTPYVSVERNSLLSHYSEFPSSPVHIESGSQVYIKNNTIAGNQQSNTLNSSYDRAGGILVDMSDGGEHVLEIYHNTLYDNQPPSVEEPHHLQLVLHGEGWKNIRVANNLFYLSEESSQRQCDYLRGSNQLYRSDMLNHFWGNLSNDKDCLPESILPSSGLEGWISRVITTDYSQLALLPQETGPLISRGDPRYCESDDQFGRARILSLEDDEVHCDVGAIELDVLHDATVPDPEWALEIKKLDLDSLRSFQ